MLHWPQEACERGHHHILGTYHSTSSNIHTHIMAYVCLQLHASNYRRMPIKTLLHILQRYRGTLMGSRTSRTIGVRRRCQQVLCFWRSTMANQTSGSISPLQTTTRKKWAGGASAPPLRAAWPILCAARLTSRLSSSKLPVPRP